MNAALLAVDQQGAWRKSKVVPGVDARVGGVRRLTGEATEANGQSLVDVRVEAVNLGESRWRLQDINDTCETYETNETNVTPKTQN